MLGMYANQDITLKRAGTPDSYNQVTYIDVAIKARFEYKRKEVRDKSGQKVISEATMITETKVNDKDAVFYAGRLWPVISIKEPTGLGGAVEFYEVML